MPPNSSPSAGTPTTPSTGRAVADQADIDRELVMPGSELPRAVQRIDQPVVGRHVVARGRRRISSSAITWMSGVAGRNPAAISASACVVGLGHRAVVVLVERLEPAGPDGQDDGPRLAGEVGGEGEQGGVVHGSIRPTCLTASRCHMRHALASPPRAATLAVFRTQHRGISMLSIDFARAAMPGSGALALLVPEGRTRPGWRRRRTRRAAARWRRAFAAAKFTGKKGSTCTVLAPGAGLTRVVAVGLGKPDGTDRARRRGGRRRAGRRPGRRGGGGASQTGALSPEHAAAAAMGAALRSYRFDRYRTKEKPEDKPQARPSLTVLCADPAARRPRPGRRWRRWRDGVCLARDLVSEPPNVLFPAEMADRCRALEELGVKVEVFGPKEMDKLGFGMLMGVSLGSATEPRMVVMRWNGASGRGGKGKARAKKGEPKACPPAARLHRQGRHLRHRRHLHQAGRRHGGHEVGHGRRRRGDRRHGRTRRAPRPGRRGRPGGPGREHAQQHRPAARATW